MRMYDIIIKKRDGNELSKEEIQFFIDGYVSGQIPDYQASALLMSIYFMGMSERETTDLTMCMAASGDMIDLNSITGKKVDKHSTGGVGDKTTFIVSSIVASLGVPVTKISGRGLGYTGGTIDKMESIPGIKTNITREKFLEIIRHVGMSVVGQSGNLVPADKKLYALRDVTGTIESIPLIASSIMSKKIAAGSDCILLDVKVGSGAFMKNDDHAIELAKLMVNIGERVGRKTVALISDMSCPLGNNIGNSLEIIEVCDTLNGSGPEDLEKLCVEISANMLHLAGKNEKLSECVRMATESIKTGLAFKKFKEMVLAQDGDISVLDDTSKFLCDTVKHNVYSNTNGYIGSIDSEICGITSVLLGAGREKKESKIDLNAGIVLNKKIGDRVEKGEIIATFYSGSINKCILAERKFKEAVVINDHMAAKPPVIRVKVTKDGVEKFI